MIFNKIFFEYLNHFYIIFDFLNKKKIIFAFKKFYINYFTIILLK